MKPRALFICGSINQTRQLHAVARELPELEQRFSPWYGDTLVEWMRRAGLVEMTIGGNKRRGWCLDHLRAHDLPLDENGREGGYDLVVTCGDTIVPKNVRRSKVVVVQEGILDPERFAYFVCSRLRFLPPWLAGTAMTGMSGLFDRFCAASEGYRQHFVSHGADPAKIVVTGMPNFDDCAAYLENDFPHRGYVLACTSDTRETLKLWERRAPFIRRALAVARARGKALFVKLHPNENEARARRELARLAPSAVVYSGGSAEEMIANCDVLFTQWSSTAFVGMALGKEVYSGWSTEELHRLLPVQNGGASARNIARVCRDLLGLRSIAVPEEAHP